VRADCSVSRSRYIKPDGFTLAFGSDNDGDDFAFIQTNQYGVGQKSSFVGSISSRPLLRQVLNPGEFPDTDAPLKL
jgi:hypothetical protein